MRSSCSNISVQANSETKTMHISRTEESDKKRMLNGVQYYSHYISVPLFKACDLNLTVTKSIHDFHALPRTLKQAPNFGKFKSLIRTHFWLLNFEYVI